MKKKLVILLSIILSSILFAFPDTQTIAGKEYTFEYSEIPVNAVSLSHFTTEIMLKLDLKNNMAGTAFKEEEIYPSVAKDYAEVPVIAKRWPSIEQVLNVDADFASGWEVPFTKRAIEADGLVQNGVNIFIPKSSQSLDADMETLFNDFLMFGKIFGREGTAMNYVNSERARLNEITKKLKNNKEFTFFLYDSGTDELFTMYEGFTTNLFKLINGKNILSGKGVKETWGSASWEQVIHEDPEYIVIIDYSEAIREQTDAEGKIKYIKENPILKDVKAVKNNNFIIVKLAEICPGIRNVDFLEKASNQVYNK